MPAAPLVIAAYSIAWILLIGYLWSIWRRLTKVQQEIAQVSRRLESGSRPSSGGTGR
jgi:CcmD family protein